MRLFNHEMGPCEGMSMDMNVVSYTKVKLSKEGAKYFQLVEDNYYDIHVDLTNCKVTVYYNSIITREIEFLV